MNYAKFLKPSRYIGGEINCKIKEQSKIRIALAFADLYEVGMSHIGLKILYEIINKLPDVAAERAFMPALDMADYLRDKKIPLCSMESKRPLGDFDVVGFSLQYELSYTTVLEMLNLSCIPIFTEDRLNSKSTYPLVIAGGPCTVNPLPLLSYVDAFFIGEAEDAVLELIDVLRRCKDEGIRDNRAILGAIADIEGFYVPCIHREHTKIIKRRYVQDLDSYPFPVKPVVPYMSVVHDRVAVEVTRGCPRGCRFCQAGMIYRPFRERSVSSVLSIAGESLKNTGHDTVSFASLSAGDYGCLVEAMRMFNNQFRSKHVGLSLPSLRVGSVNKEMLKELKSVRKSGFTIAPEAATDRLRRVINKDFTGQDYERALIELFEAGWLNLKLYFMIGLPTERQEDIEAIIRMANQALKAAKAKTKRFVNISVTVSPFIPKAHTAFQWLGQAPILYIEEKLSYLRGKLADKGIKYKGHDPKMSLLEAAIARADESFSPLIYKAWQRGAILDGWSEHFDFNLWQKASEETGIDINIYAQRGFQIDETLPWDFIDTGIDKDFLRGQYKAAYSEILSPACDVACSDCGLSCASAGMCKADNSLLTPQQVQTSTKGSQRVKARVRFSKTGLLRHLSHLELSHALLRALRRADVRIAFSMGFNPAPIVSFSPPLSVAVAGLSEYFDMEVFTPFDIELTMDILNQTLPQGLRIENISLIPLNSPSLTAFICRYDYLIKSTNTSKLSLSADKVEEITATRDGKETKISDFINELSFQSHDLVFLSLIDRDTKKARLSEIVKALFNADLADLDITRTAMYGYDKGWVKPL